MKRKKKIGIVTILDNTNIGNRLQNYAVQECYNELGVKAVTLGRHSSAQETNGRICNRVGLKFFCKSAYYFGVMETIFNGSSRRFLFGKFNRNIKLSHGIPVFSEIKKVANHYDFFQ